MSQVKVVIRDMPNSQALEEHVRKKAEKLSLYCDRIHLCQVVIEVPQKHKRQGKLFNVRIDITVPGKELVVNRNLNEDVYVAVRDAFRALIRQLETYDGKRRGNVKNHNHVDRGYIKRLVADENYGFIQGVDGNEYYFSMTNVAHPHFSQLAVGDVVEFMGMPGSEGFQAHRVTMEGHQYVEAEEE